MPPVGLVVVSHSRPLAEAAVALASEMLHGSSVSVQVAAGLDDGGLGTDAAAIVEALGAADSGEGVVVLMDLGSAVLSAELALELLDDEARERVVLSPAPLVEGLVVAAVAAAGGADREHVAQEAAAGLAAKHAQLGVPAATAPPSPDTGGDAEIAGFDVAGAHGLHARPAARLVQHAAAAGVPLELRNVTTGSGWVPAASLSSLATLDARQGHRLEVRGTGPGAREAVDALAAYAAGLEAGPETADPETAGPAPSEVASGPARVLPPEVLDVPDTPSAGAEQERARLEQARDAVREQVRRTRTAAQDAVGEAEAAVFDAHLLMLDDDDLVRDAHARVDAGASAEQGWAAAVDRVVGVFGGLSDPYLRERAADVRALGDAVLRTLAGRSEPSADVAGVLVAEDLSPAQAVTLDPSRTLGVVLARGSATSHSALVLKALGIPVVVGAGDDVLSIADGTPLLVDGRTGELIVDPDAAALRRVRS